VRYYRAFSIVDGVVNTLDHRFSQHDEIGRYLKLRLRRQIEDLAGNAVDPMGVLVALSTEFAFRTNEVRGIIYGTSKSFDSAVARVLLVVAGVKRKLAQLAWAAAIFSLTLDVLVRTRLLPRGMVFVHGGIFGRIDVGDIAEFFVPMCMVALALGWFGRLLRARAYTGSPERPIPGRQAQRE